MSRAPVLAFVGANGLVGKSMLPDFVDALRSGKISSLRVLTTRPEALDGDLTSAKGVEMINVGKYTDADKIQAALEGAQILVSAMGTKEGYHENKTTLLECAAKAGIKVRCDSGALQYIRSFHRACVYTGVRAQRVWHGPQQRRSKEVRHCPRSRHFDRTDTRRTRAGSTRPCS